MKEGYILGGRLYCVEYQYDEKGNVRAKTMEDTGLRIYVEGAIDGPILYSPMNYELFIKFVSSR